MFWFYIVPGGKKGRSSSWEATGASVSQEIFHILWNTDVPYRIHKRPPPTAILSQINPVDDILRIFWRFILVLYLPPTSRSFRWSLSNRHTKQHPVCTSPVPHTWFIHHSSHFSWFDHGITFGEEYRTWSSSIYSLLHNRYLVPLRSIHLPQHPILEHPQSMFIPQCDSFTPASKEEKSAVCCTVYISICCTVYLSTVYILTNMYVRV